MRTLIDLLIAHGLGWVFLFTLAARIGLPVPAAPLLVVAGGLAASGLISWPLVLLVSILANLAGDGLWYEAGRRHGHRVMRLLCRISLSPDSCVRQSESLITRWGGRSLLAAKFLPGISVVAAPMAGALHMSLTRFVAFDVLAGAVWSAVFLALGFLLSDQIQQVLDMLASAGLFALIALLLVVAGLIVRRWWMRQRFLREAQGLRIDVDGAAAMVDQGLAPVFIDVRSNGSRSIDPRSIPGAVLTELGRLHEHAPQLPLDRELVLYCNCPNEASAAVAARTLMGLGFTRVRTLTGGLDGWAAAGRPITAL